MYEKTQQGPVQPIPERLAHTMSLLKQYDASTKEAEQTLRGLGFSSIDEARSFVQAEMAKLRHG